MDMKKRPISTGHSYRLWFRAKKKKSPENGVKKEGHVPEKDQHVTESNHLNKQVTVKDAHRLDDQREKQTCSLEENDKKEIEPFKSELIVDKSSTSKFVEYWVPVKLSNEQIEQYCACLFSNSVCLCSSLKKDAPSSLHDILVSTRKCCDHPYLEDRSLRDIVIKGIPVDQHLDAEIKLSGKLELLNKILQEIKQQGQRVLILFRSLGGSGVISIGDILDEIIHEKFGVDSYTRISGNIAPAKKKATLDNFNSKGSGKFACLMETRDCTPSIKLSRIDTIILFNSDWDPTNDFRSLQKIAVYSKLEHVKVFRLYSCFTVEEKALILAKKGLTVDSNIMNTKQAACHELLTWGTSYLFNMLDCFHAQSSNSKKSSEVAALDDVFAEFLALMSSNSENSDKKICSNILRVQQKGGSYPRKISLLGELEIQLMNDSSIVRGLMENELPNVFWTNLLHGRVPRWKHLPSPSQGIRRKVKPRGDLHQLSKGEQVSEKKARKEGNKVHSTPDPKLRMKRKLPVQGKRQKLGMSHLSAGNKHKYRRLVTIPNSMQSKQLPAANTSTSIDRDQAHEFVLSDNLQSHRNCIDSSSHQVLDSMDLQPEESNWPIDSSTQLSAGNSPLQQPISTGAVNDTSMGSRNNQEHQCNPDASPNTPELRQTPCLHPLQMVMERIHKEREQITKLHEDVKLHLKSEFESELDAITKKYDLLLQIAEKEIVQKQKYLDTLYNKVHVNKLLAEAMITQIQDTADTVQSLEMTLGTGQSSPSRSSSVPAMTASTQPASQSSDDIHNVCFPHVGRTIIGAEQSSPSRSSSVPAVTASTQPASQSSDDIHNVCFPHVGRTIIGTGQSSPSRLDSVQAVTASTQPASQSSDDVHNVCFPHVGRTIIGTGQSSPSRSNSVPAVTASTQPASQSSDVLEYPSLVSEPVNSGKRASAPQISPENFPMAAILSQTAELAKVTHLAAVPLTSATAILQTISSANLPASCSPVTPTPNLQPVILTPVLSTSFPSQLSIQTLSYTTSPAASCELRKPAPHLGHFRPLPILKSWNSGLLEW